MAKTMTLRIEQLRPMQATVGMLEVNAKKKHLLQLDERALKTFPDTVSALSDDPFRGLAAFVRNAGGYLKTPEPFAEFQWAGFYRTRIPMWTNEFQFHAAVEQAVHLASSPDARTLPGFKKPGRKAG